MDKLVFNKHSVQEYLARLPKAEAFFTNLESVEHWVLDGQPMVMLAIEKWVKSLSDRSVEYLTANSDALLVILGFMSARNSFYLQDLLKQRQPNLLEHLTARARFLVDGLDSSSLESRAALIFIDRLKAAALNETLNYFLNQERMALINHIVRKVQKKYGALTE